VQILELPPITHLGRESPRREVVMRDSPARLHRPGVKNPRDRSGRDAWVAQEFIGCLNRILVPAQFYRSIREPRNELPVLIPCAQRVLNLRFQLVAPASAWSRQLPAGEGGDGREGVLIGVRQDCPLGLMRQT